MHYRPEWPNTPVIPMRSEESVQLRDTGKTLYNVAAAGYYPSSLPMGLRLFVCNKCIRRLRSEHPRALQLPTSKRSYVYSKP